MDFIQKTLSPDKTNRQRTILFLLISAYALVFSYMSISKHRAYFSGYDLAIFTQMYWTTLHGNFFMSTLEGVNHFGFHNSPVLVLLIPFFYFYQHAESLLVIQSIILALGALPIYLIAKHEFDENTGLVFAALYLMNPALHGVNLADFHEIAFVPLFIGFTFYFLKTGDFGKYAVFALLSLCIREDVAIIVLAISLWGMYHYHNTVIREKKLIPVIGLIAIAWIIISVFVLIPSFHNGVYLQVNRYESLTPQSVTAHLNEKTLFMVELLFPLGFFPLLSPDILAIAVPSLAELLLSTSMYTYDISFQYPALIITVLFIATINGLSYLSRHPVIKQYLDLKIVLIYLIVCSSVAVCSFDPMLSQHYKFTSSISDGSLDSALQMVPENASVSTQGNIAPHLADRYGIYQKSINNADFVVVATKHEAGDHFYNVLANSENQQDLKENFKIVVNTSDITIYKNTFVARQCPEP